MVADLVSELPVIPSDSSTMLAMTHLPVCVHSVACTYVSHQRSTLRCPLCQQVREPRMWCSFCLQLFIKDREMKEGRYSCSLVLVETTLRVNYVIFRASPQGWASITAVVLKYVHKFFDIPPFKRWSLIPFPLNAGWMVTCFLRIKDEGNYARWHPRLSQNDWLLPDSLS